MSVGINVQRTPAWKRLGLQLKSAQKCEENQTGSSNQEQPQLLAHEAARATFDNPSYVSGTAAHTNSAALISLDHTSGPETSASKKRKRPSGSNQELSQKEWLSPASTALTGLRKIESDVSGNPRNGALEHETKTRQKRSKSVTFTSDTKSQDGDSARTFAAPSSDPDPEPSPQEYQAVDDTASLSAASERVKERKPRVKRSDAYIEYLRQFHEDKSNWKFNKAKQTDLLKNTWNLFRVPPEFHEALIAYLAGLRGEAARERLVTAAKERINKRVQALREDPSSTDAKMSTRAGREAASNQVLLRYLRRKDPELTEDEFKELLRKVAEEDEVRKAQELMRAEAVLADAFRQEHELERSGGVQASTKATTRRSRKQRTDVKGSSDSTTSSSSSEDSESSTEPSDSSDDEDDDDDENDDDDDDEEASESSDDSGPEGKIFNKKFLDKVRPKEKKKFAAIKARAAEIKRQRLAGGE